MCANPQKKLNRGNVVISKMDKEKCQEELVYLFSSVHIETTTNAKVEQHQNQLTNLINTLAPIKRKKVQRDMKQPWYEIQLG